MGFGPGRVLKTALMGNVGSRISTKGLHEKKLMVVK